MSKGQVQKLCKLWQKRLRLQDWEIQIIPHAFDEPSQRGDCTTYKYMHKADIRIDLTYVDPEQVLVHELLHLNFPTDWLGLDDQEHVKYKVYENAIDSVAKALVEGYRA